MFTVGQIVTRNDNGRKVRIVDVRPSGLHLFYVTEDVQDEHTAILDATQLRPVFESEPHVVGTDAPTPENDPIGRFRRREKESAS